MSDFEPRSPGNVFDSRDAQEYLDEIEAAWSGVDEENPCSDCLATDKDAHEADCELAEDIRVLHELAEEASGEWESGITFIADSYFEDYARQLAEDIGAIESDAGWPACCIDWERAAQELQVDYTSTHLFGTTYWYR